MIAPVSVHCFSITFNGIPTLPSDSEVVQKHLVSCSVHMSTSFTKLSAHNQLLHITDAVLGITETLPTTIEIGQYHINSVIYVTEVVVIAQMSAGTTEGMIGYQIVSHTRKSMGI